MSATFNADPDTQGPLTRAIINAHNPFARHPVPAAEVIGALLDAIHDLEQRVIALEVNQQ